MKTNCPKWFNPRLHEKYCLICCVQMFPKSWKGKRIYFESQKRFEEKILCSLECRAKQLKQLPPEANYFFGKHLVPWNKGKYKGWRHTDERGYIRLYRKKGDFVYEHRIVAEKKYGRAIQKDELVHHKDHNTSNNDPVNLEIMMRSEHQSLHNRERFS